MDVALHLAPERAKALVGRIDVLDDGDARQRLGGDVLVVSKPSKMAPAGCADAARASG